MAVFVPGGSFFCCIWGTAPFVGGDGAHIRPSAGFVLHQSCRRQLPQGFPYRCLAHAEFLRELQLHEAGARRVDPFDDAVDNDLFDLLGEAFCRKS